MDESTRRALKNAAASSAMEGLPLDREDLRIVRELLEGKRELREYLKQLRKQEQEA